MYPTSSAVVSPRETVSGREEVPGFPSSVWMTQIFLCSRLSGKGYRLISICLRPENMRSHQPLRISSPICRSGSSSSSTISLSSHLFIQNAVADFCNAAFRFGLSESCLRSTGNCYIHSTPKKQTLVSNRFSARLESSRRCPPQVEQICKSDQLF